MLVPLDLPDLQSAIIYSEAGSTIKLSSGTYEGSSTLWWKALTIQGTEGAFSTTLDGAGEGPVLDIRGVQGGITVEGLTLSGGRAYGGAGLRLSGSVVDIQDLVIEENSASVAGGGLAILDCEGLLKNLTINENSAGFAGGGMYQNSSSASFENLTIRNNVAGVSGGGLYSNSTDCEMTTVEVSNNFAGQTGGGMHFNYGDPTLQHALITDNVAGASGGGIYLSYYSFAKIYHSIFTNNSATFSGGALGLDNSSPTISQSVLSKNTSLTGGGLYASIGSYPTINNTILNLNAATDGENLYAVNFTPNLSNVLAWTGIPHITGIYAGVNTGGETLNVIVADPLFLDEPDGDYRLLAEDSSAINKGSPLCLDEETGMFTTPCSDPDGSIPDIGAFGGPGAGGDADDDDYSTSPWWPENSNGDAIVNSGYLVELDCDDNSSVTYPGAIELVDGLDNDCDGEIDEDSEAECSIAPSSQPVSAMALLLMLGVLRRRRN